MAGVKGMIIGVDVRGIYSRLQSDARTRLNADEQRGLAARAKRLLDENKKLRRMLNK